MNVNTADAALSARTAKTIKGTQPYLTFDGGVTKVTNTNGFLGIKLSDGRHIIFAINAAYPSAIINTSTLSNPIELPVVGQSFADITMFIPASSAPVSSRDPTQQVALNTLINLSSPSYWGDTDGDGQGSGGVSATGSLKLEIKDINGVKVKRSDVLNPCYSPYTVTLTSTAGTLSTQYGDPNSTAFTGGSVTYYIKPKITQVKACWATPNLAYNTSNWNHSGDRSQMSGPATQWSDEHGFLPQSGTNFPTTGLDRLFFDFTVGGVLGNEVTITKNFGTGVTATLTPVANRNVVRVTLRGPSYPAGGSFSDTKFTLKAKSVDVYTFTIDKWYIANPNSQSHDGKAPPSQGGGTVSSMKKFCINDLAGGYTVPVVTDLSNGNGWNGGLSGQPNYYKRKIGGGLFAEWGYPYTKDDGAYYGGADLNVYTSLKNAYYWTYSAYTCAADYYHIVPSADGQIAYQHKSHMGVEYKVICVKD